MGKYVNKDICSQCKGKCCKKMGCEFSPKDFKDLSFEGLRKEIDKGYISIDWWEGNIFHDGRQIHRIYYLRMRNLASRSGTKAKAPVVDPSWGGQCCMLTENGCPFSFDDRPMGGKMLIPSENEECDSDYTKKQCVKDWYEHRGVLSELEDYYC